MEEEMQERTVSGRVLVRRKRGRQMFVVISREKQGLRNVQVVIERSDPGAGLFMLGTDVYVEGVLENHSENRAEIQAQIEETTKPLESLELEGIEVVARLEGRREMSLAGKEIRAPVEVERSNKETGDSDNSNDARQQQQQQEQKQRPDSIMVRKWKILRVNGGAGLKAVERILDTPRSVIPMEDVSIALNCCQDETIQLLSLEPGSSERKKHVTRVLRRLNGLPEDWSRVRPTKITGHDKAILEDIEKRLSCVFKLELCDAAGYTLASKGLNERIAFTAKSGGGQHTRAERKRKMKAGEFGELSDTEFSLRLSKLKKEEEQELLAIGSKSSTTSKPATIQDGITHSRDLSQEPLAQLA